jgi:hypothetical protein
MNKWKGHTLIALRLLGILLVVFLAWLFWGLIGIKWLTQYWKPDAGNNSLAEFGQVGDLFGGFNALFAALAFAGVAVAAYLQGKALKLAHEQHARQAFEPLFFQLLNLHKTISETITLTIPHSWPVIPQQYNIDQATGHLHRQIIARWGAIVIAEQVQRKALILQPYEEFYILNEDELGPYFRSLYHIFKLVHQSGLDAATRVTYSNIARAMLGTDILFLLSINCISNRGEKFRLIVESYGLLKHLKLVSAGQPTIEKLIVDWFYEETAIMSYEERELHLKK